MIDERYKKYIEVLSTTYRDRLGTNPKFNELEFVDNINKFMNLPNFNLSPARKGVIDRLVEKLIEGKGKYANNGGGATPPPAPQEPIVKGRLQAQKGDEGWQIYIDGTPIGQQIDYKAAGGIINWLQHGAMTDLGLEQAAPDNGDPEALPF